MKKFRSVALDGEGKKYAGSFEAENEAAALAMLHSQGFQVLSLEEIVEPEVEVENTARLKVKARIEKKSSGPPTNEVTKAGFLLRRGGLGTSGLWKTIGIGAAVLGGIPLLVYVFMPRPPLNSPEDAAAAYFQAEIAGDYAAQYETFSSGRLMLAGSKETYVNKRTADAKRLRPVPAEPREGETEDDALAKAAQIAPVLAGVEKKSDDGQEAEAAAFIVRSSIHEEYAVKLLLEKRLWKIREVKFVKRKELGKPKAELDTAEVETEVVRKPEERKTAPSQTEKAPPAKAEPAEPALPSEKSSGPPGKANVTKAKEQALGLIEEARDRGVIDEKEFQARKKQLGFK